MRVFIPRGVNTLDVPVPTLKRGRGRGKVVELTNAPLLIPTIQSHLSGVTKPKEGLKIAIPAEGNAMNGDAATAFPPAIQHLSKLDKVASEAWELSEPTSVEPGLVVEIPEETPPEDSDVDL